MKNIIKKIASYIVIITVLLGVQSFINPIPAPIPKAQSSIVYITGCPTAYAMYVNIVGTDDGPPFGMTMEDDLTELTISGTETFISDHTIKYYCDAYDYPTAYIYIKQTSSSDYSYVGSIHPYCDNISSVISGDRLTSMSIAYNSIPQD